MATRGAQNASCSRQIARPPRALLVALVVSTLAEMGGTAAAERWATEAMTGSALGP